MIFQHTTSDWFANMSSRIQLSLPRLLFTLKSAALAKVASLFSLLSIAIAPLPAHSQSLLDYRCTIERYVSASTLSEPVRRNKEVQYLGKEFTVERRTGVMAGVLKNSYVTAPVVIDFGSMNNAFKVVTTMRLDQGAGAGSMIYALTINEFEASSKKSFAFLENDIVYLGRCEHF